MKTEPDDQEKAEHGAGKGKDAVKEKTLLTLRRHLNHPKLPHAAPAKLHQAFTLLYLTLAEFS